MKSMTYAGIGSRGTPQYIQDYMTKIAAQLEKRGYILNSGGAIGADSAFGRGTSKNKNIFIPWDGFNSIYDGIVHNPNSELGIKATQFVYDIHPKPRALSQGAMKLQARNSYQILGTDLKTPVDFVLCWTHCGMERESERTKNSGGTAQAISIASRYNIPVINMSKDNWKEKFRIVLDRLSKI